MNNKTRLCSLTCRYALSLLIGFSAHCISVSVGASTTDVFFLSHDQQGSITSISDEKNQLVLQQGWSSWGERLDTNRQNTVSRFAQGHPMRLGYTGHKQLLDANLVFAGDTRLYDPGLKRFYNTDDRTTGGVRGNNRLSYTYNNPLSYIDPDGHAPVRIYGENNRLPANEFITAVLEIPRHPNIRGQLNTARDRQLAEMQKRQIAADPNNRPEDVYIKPELTLGSPLLCAPISGRSVSVLAGHSNLVAHAMGWRTEDFLHSIARKEFGCGTGKGRFVGGGFILSNTETVLIHPWSSFKASGDLLPEAVQYWERHKWVPTLASVESQSTVNPTVVQYRSQTDMALAGTVPPGFMPFSYWEQYINAISARTQLPIHIEPFESDRFVWYETKHGPRRDMIKKLMRHYPKYFSSMETLLPQIVERANRRL